MIDFSQMTDVRIDADTSRVRVQPGAVWGDVDRATQPHNLAIPSGVISTTGVAGLTLGGGFGWLTRKWGHTVDHLRSVTIVTADGHVRRASDDEHPDLFWGIKGGGGNFGVITEFEFEARQLNQTVVAGLILYPMEDASDVTRFYREFTESAPEELGSLLVLRIAPAAPFLPTEVHGKPVVGIIVCYAGPIEDGERALAPLKAYGSPLADTIKPKPFTEHQSFLDSGQPRGRNYYWKSEYISVVEDDLAESLIHHSHGFTSSFSSVLTMHLGGATKRVDNDTAAVSHRNANYIVVIQAAWEDSERSSEHIEWARRFHSDVLPHSIGGTYVNFLTEEEGSDRVRQAYAPETYQKLVSLKDIYDPGNHFRLNKNIAPSRIPAAT